MPNVCHVVGTGTIGLPLIGLLTRHKKDFEIDEVTFHKNTPLNQDIAGIRQLIKEGAILSTDKEKLIEFKDLGVDPQHTREEAINRATVVLDCTPKGFGIKNKAEYYNKFKNTVKGFIAQGSESGFGKPFAYRINNEALTKDDQFIQVVSCNTHNMCALVKSFLSLYRYYGFDADFVCIRRSSDISQDELSPGVVVDKHKNSTYGTHHAVDARRVLKTLNTDSDYSIDNHVKMYSSSCVVPSQYMHSLRFRLSFKETITLEKAVREFEKNPLIAFTHKNTSNSIFSFGRDYGHYGRILNQTVISLPTLSVEENRLTGFCFTPQDGNSLLSSVASVLWFLCDRSWELVEEKMKVLSPYLFKEI
jgi:glyceraldehyde-3-phosphate dehydrogenase type II